MNLIFITTQEQLSEYYIIVESAIKMILFKRGLKLAPVSSIYRLILDGILRASWSFIALIRKSYVT
jgi:hypothetical protein